MLGIWGGTIAHIILAIIGLSAIIAASAWAFDLVKWCGVLYLIWLGVSALMADASSVEQAKPVAPPMKANVLRIFGQGFFITLLNPKVAIFFLGFLPLFVEPNAGPAWAQLLLHGLLLIVVAALIEPFWILIGEKLTVKLRHAPTLIPWLNRGMGTILIALGIRLSFETH